MSVMLTGVDMIGTYGAYHRGYFESNNVIVFPYINLTINYLETIQKLSDVVFLDYGYIILIDPFLLKQTSIAFEPNVLTLGGINLSLGVDTEINIKFSEGFLQIPKESTFSKEPFSPVDSGIFKRNMDEEKMDGFFKKENLPLNLKRLLGL